MKKEPSYDHLRIIGCLCYGSGSEKKGDKFEGKGIRSIMLGYPYGQKGYKLYDLEKKRTYISRDVVFKEHIFPFLLKPGEENHMKMVMNEVPVLEKNKKEQGDVRDEESLEIQEMEESDDVEGGTKWNRRGRRNQ